MSGIVVYRLEKSYVDKLVARNPLYFNLVSTKFLLTNEVSNLLTVYYDMSVDSSKKGISIESSSSTRAKICNESSFMWSCVKLR